MQATRKSCSRKYKILESVFDSSPGSILHSVHYQASECMDRVPWADLAPRRCTACDKITFPVMYLFHCACAYMYIHSFIYPFINSFIFIKFSCAKNCVQYPWFYGTQPLHLYTAQEWYSNHTIIIQNRTEHTLAALAPTYRLPFSLHGY
jgi:hypothetical protein